MTHPVSALMADWLPECDFAVLDHGFSVHGRDYEIIIQTNLGPQPGTHRLVFTHVVRADCQTALSPGGWSESWDDVFLDYERSKDMNGYVWGVNWSLAYPGVTPLVDDAEADDWRTKIGHAMYALLLETDRFGLRLVFHSVRSEKLSKDASLVGQVVHLLQAR